MSLITGQATIGTSPTTLFTERGGGYCVTITSDPASADTVYINASTGQGTSTSTGVPIAPGGQLSWASYAVSSSAVVSAVTTAPSGAVIGWIISPYKT